MRAELKIAARYLFSRKSGDVITWISWIGVVGIAIGTMALVVVLSVFNGFTDLITKNIEQNSSYYKIVPAEGRHIAAADTLERALSSVVGVSYIQQVVEDMVAVRYDTAESLTLLRGVGSVNEFSISSEAARELGVRVNLLSKIELLYPSFSENISARVPIRKIEQRPRRIFDGSPSMVVVPIQKARELLGLSKGVSSYMEVYCDGWDVAPPTITQLEANIGSKYKILDRRKQNPGVFRVMRHEKFAIYLVLFFIIIVVAMNIYASLSMLIIEKKQDIAILSALGCNKKMLRNIFYYEGMMATFIGLLSGGLIGLALALMQQHFGFVHMPGNGVVSSYPINVKMIDVVLSSCGVALIGCIVSKLSVRNI